MFGATRPSGGYTTLGELTQIVNAAKDYGCKEMDVWAVVLLADDVAPLQDWLDDVLAPLIEAANAPTA